MAMYTGIIYTPSAVQMIIIVLGDNFNIEKKNKLGVLVKSVSQSLIKFKLWFPSGLMASMWCFHRQVQ